MKTSKQVLQCVIVIMTLFLSHRISAQSWNTGGNAGTNPASNYVGTSDNADLVLRTFATERLRIQASGNVGIGIATPVQKLDVKGNINISVNNGIYTNNKRVFLATSSGVTKSNVYAGTNAGFTGTGYYNSFFGTEAGYANSSYHNTFLGAYCGRNNTSGSGNTFAGSTSGFTNSTGGSNSFFGYSSGWANQTGSDNTFLGNTSGAANTTGDQNAFIGSSAGAQNIDGGLNTATGYQVMFLNQHGFNNSAYGCQALYSNTASGNSAFGGLALNNNTTGGSNTAVGSSSLLGVTTGSENVGIGVGAGSYSIGSQNTLVGTSTSFFNGGDGNTQIGFSAGSSGFIFPVTSYYSTSLGYLASNAGYTNSMALGSNTKCTADNQVHVGDNNITSISGKVDWTVYSDGRVKKNIHENVPGLDFINQLRPVTYNFDLDAMDQITGKTPMKSADGKEIAPTQAQLDARRAGEGILYSGFIAQEVEKTAQQIGYDFSGVDPAKNDHDLYGLRYAQFVVPLVKSVQELSKQQEELKSRNQKLEVANDAMKLELADLKAQPAAPEMEKSELQHQVKALAEKIDELESGFAESKSEASTSGFAKLTFDASGKVSLLGQNIPNPFDQSTLIPFRIPANCHDASIMITSTSSARVISVIPIACNEDHLTLDAGTFDAGSYAYTLYVDGKVVVTRQMEIVH